MSSYRLTTLGSNTELLELPFDRPLAEWDDRWIVYVPRGISRHVVRFVEAGGEIFAVKESPDRFVVREHRLLRGIAEEQVPVVDAYGMVTGRTDSDTETMHKRLRAGTCSSARPRNSRCSRTTKRSGDSLTAKISPPASTNQTMPGDPARHVHDPPVVPFRERPVKGSCEELGVRAERGEPVAAHRAQPRPPRSPGADGLGHQIAEEVVGLTVVRPRRTNQRQTFAQSRSQVVRRPAGWRPGRRSAAGR